MADPAVAGTDGEAVGSPDQDGRLEGGLGDEHDGPFDVFLSYAREDEAAVHRIAALLREEELRPWLDVWATTAGKPWQDQIADGLRRSRSCAVFVGAHRRDGASTPTLGAWEREEVLVAINRAATDPTFRVFLVLLEGVPEPFDAGVLHPFLAMRTWVDLRRGTAQQQTRQQLLNAVRGIPSEPPHAEDRDEDECPYRGLAAFDEGDARFFFGRDAERQRVLEKLKSSSFVTVVGPSGSGKSSLVRAGVVPQVRTGALPAADAWTICTMTPGGRPLDTLASRLVGLDTGLSVGEIRDQLAGDDRTLRLLSSGLAGGRRLLLVVDQFEEIFTICSNDEERDRLIGNLLEATAGDASCSVLLTLRADFYPRCAAVPELAQRVSAHQFLVGPMDRESLRAVIEEPARLVRLSLEPGLVDVILDDVTGEAGSLPLLEHALLELWRRRLGDLLTLEGYHEAGGVTGALAKRADATWEGLTPDEQRTARRVLLRLTRPGEGAEDTRQRAYLEELSGAAHERSTVDDVVRELADARLLAVNVDLRTERVLVDVTHEALIRGWPRLRQWVDENREGLQVHHRITEGARGWEELDRDPGALYRGARLATAREWAADNDDQLNELERAFLEQSSAAERQELEEQRQRAEAERLRAEKEARSARRLRRLAVALAALLLATTGATAVAAVQTGRANEQARRAAAAARTSNAEALAGRAVNLVGSQPEQALLLGLEAVEMSSTPAVFSGLQQVGVLSARIHAFLHGHEGPIFRVEASPAEHAWEGEELVVRAGGPVRLVASAGQDGAVRLWDSATGQAIGSPLLGHEGPVATLAISADGTVLASGGEDGTILLWSLAKREAIGDLHGHTGAVFSLAFRPGPVALLASGGADGTLRLWDVPRQEEIARHFANGGEQAQGGRPTDDVLDDVSHVTYRRDGSLLATAGRDGSIQLWAPDGTRLTAPQPAHSGLAISDIEFAQGGAVLVSGGRDGTVRFWDVGDDGILPRAVRRDHVEPVFAIATSADGELAASAGVDGGIIVWSVDEATPRGDALRAHARNVLTLAFDHRGQLLSAGVDGVVVVWDAASAVPPWLGRSLPGRRIVAAAGSIVVAGGAAGLAWHDAATLEPVATPLDREVVTALAARPPPRGGPGVADVPVEVASGSAGGLVRLWDGTGRVAAAPLQLTAEVKALAFSPVAPLLVAADASGALTVFDLERGEAVHVFSDEPGVRDLAVSPDGGTLAAAGGDHRVRLWSLREHGAVGTVPSDEAARRRGVEHSAWAVAVAFSPDGAVLASGSLDGTIALWDVGTGAPAGRALQARGGQVTAVAISSDGTTLAGATDTGGVELWDLDGPGEAHWLGSLREPHSSWTWAMGFTADDRLLTASDDGVAVVWDGIVTAGDLDRWRARVCSVAGTTLTRDEWAMHIGDDPYAPSCSDAG